MKPKVLIFSGYGFQSEEETKLGFELAGANVDIVHINDLIENLYHLSDYQILAFPGGFSYGDDTGSGNAYANKLKNHLWEDMQNFVMKDKLIIGICNGFQVLVNLGFVPAFGSKYGERTVALVHNESSRLICRWVDMKVITNSPWLINMTTFSAPIAHGEGKFYAPADILDKLHKKKLVAIKYTKGNIANYQDYPVNPNGSIDDIAGIIDESGRILGLMPHPERGIFSFQRPDFGFIKESCKRRGEKIPKFSDSIQIFINAVNYFS
ncbi:phosphoribosylformylglycinamidine synthase subunit PurQ [Candidatus Gottesmanbacteria bacterium]|nr:phosphoribosylformylglycinamidine synthase subunit PurQ [Candidatus Gottesmanbacteria bacterium]